MPIFGQIIWPTRNKTWFEMLNTLKALFSFLVKETSFWVYAYPASKHFVHTLINNFQTFWKQSTYQSYNDLIILLWTTIMGVTFKWYELAKWITWESMGKNYANWEGSTGEEEVLSTSHTIMHHFAVMLACTRLSITRDIAKRKQEKRK